MPKGFRSRGRHETVNNIMMVDSGSLIRERERERLREREKETEKEKGLIESLRQECERGDMHAFILIY